MTDSIKPFGTMRDGSVVEQISLVGGGLSANILTYGAVLQDLRLAGFPHPLVLGFEKFEYYLDYSPYFGATAGRCANRIRHGHLPLGDDVFQLDQNSNGHHLHGGTDGTGKRLWSIDQVAADRVSLSLRLGDGHMGYPGNIDILANFQLLEDGVLDIRYEATCDKTTLCNLAHHSYFNLDRGDTILDHLLRVDSDAYTAVDSELIPTGEVTPVEGTLMDFRKPKPVATISPNHLFDHNFCLSEQRQKLHPIGMLESRKSGLAMELRSSEPGLQVYDGAKIDIRVAGLDGRMMGAHAGMALEPQTWPDAVHNSHFPQALLHPGETYRQHTQYAFSSVKRSNSATN